MALQGLGLLLQQSWRASRALLDVCNPGDAAMAILIHFVRLLAQPTPAYQISNTAHSGFRRWDEHSDQAAIQFLADHASPKRRRKHYARFNIWNSGGLDRCFDVNCCSCAGMSRGSVQSQQGALELGRPAYGRGANGTSSLRKSTLPASAAASSRPWSADNVTGTDVPQRRQVTNKTLSAVRCWPPLVSTRHPSRASSRRTANLSVTHARRDASQV